jgi:hypothetical protein
MSLFWIAPAALAGIGLIVLPIAVHLLVRQPVRTLRFPSLRFLRQTQLASFRRRTVQELPLLICRAAIIAVGAMALAGPVIETPSRTASFASRVSRATVLVEAAPGDEPVRAQAAGAFSSATFRRSAVVDAIGEAVRWLDRQPASAREIVFTGNLRRGSIDAADIEQVPADIGVRFVAVPFPAETELTASLLAMRNGALTRIDRQLALTSDATLIGEPRESKVPPDLVTIVAPGEHRRLADAAFRAVLGDGLPWADFDQRVVVAWGPVEVASPGARVVRMPVPEPASSAADALRAALISETRQPMAKEPIAISDAQLKEWSRGPGAASPHAPRRDEGDRRWLWAAALMLLLIEWRMRRLKPAATAAIVEEARVA